MRRITAVLLVALVLPAPVFAQQQKAAGMSRAARIANALSAAPASIAAGATVADWPATEGGPLVELRPGTNGFTCLPDSDFTQGNDPMCLDEEWVRFIKAFLAGKQPNVQRVGISYMLGHGGAHGSNVHPGAQKETPDNEWGFDGPHIMLITPDTKSLEALPKTRGAQPFVMWRGTPYAHVMIPIAPAKE